MTPEPARAATLDARELDRQIAERLGWRFETPEYLTAGGYKLYDPYGMEQGHQTSWGWTTTFLKDEYKKVIPHYSTDMNAAIVLLKRMPMGGLTIDEDGVTWIATAFMDGAGVVADAEADTPALAICRAWLAYTATPQPPAAGE